MTDVARMIKTITVICVAMSWLCGDCIGRVINSSRNRKHVIPDQLRGQHEYTALQVATDMFQ